MRSARPYLAPFPHPPSPATPHPSLRPFGAQALSDFKAGKVTVLLATDLGARGVDVRRLGAVLNYDVPLALKTYVHRAGRTGRQGHAGVVFSLLKRDGPSRRFARGAARLLDLAGLPPDEGLAALTAPDATAAVAAPGQQRPRPASMVARPPAVVPAAIGDDLLAFAAAFGVNGP